VETTLREIAPDIVHMEQYMDFLRNRKFRRTLLCRREVELQRHLEPSRLAGLRVASPLVPESGRLNPRAAGDMRFQHPQGGSVTVGSPLEKAALLRLHEIWPRAETLSQICDGVRLQLGDESGPAEKDVERLGEMVLQTFSSEYVELRCGPDRFVTRLGEKPRAGRVARFQAAAGHSVTNQLHETVVLGRFDRHLVCLLDGKRDRTELVKELHMLATSGEIQITSDGQPVTDRNALRDILTRALEESLPRLASLALLVPSE
jgi:methyltransferase-like protein